MAFTGVAVFQMVSDRKCRVTGLSLALAAAGTISLAEGAGDFKLPASFHPELQTKIPDAIGSGSNTPVLVDLVEVTVVAAAAAPAAAPAVGAVKSGANTRAAFLVTFTNRDGANASGALEIWFKTAN